MSKIVTYITDVKSIDSGASEYLRGVVAEYPWFNAAKLMLLKAIGNNDAECARVRQSMDFRLSAYPAPKILLADIDKISLEKHDKISLKKPDAFDIINDFLSVDDHTIIPIEDVDSKEDMAAASSVIGDDLLTESLAELMAMQGNISGARDIYSKLSLKNPEKSVYFATLIEKLSER